MIPKTIVFDLDDTLIHEMEYLRSAFRHIAKTLDASNETLLDEMLAWQRNKENVFGNLEKRYASKTCVTDLKHAYRNHYPDFNPLSENRQMLLKLKEKGHFLGLISDGFSVTQRNKLRALDIESLFDLIVISEEFGSEKPNEANFTAFHRFNTAEYYYIADNVSKDFLVPNRLGWTSVCLLNGGDNIHTQDFDKESIYLPKIKITHLTELDL